MARQVLKRQRKQKKAYDGPEMWTTIRGRMRVFGTVFNGRKGEYMAYSTSIGRKNEDGDYDNLYLKVFFPKEDDPAVEGLCEIDVKEGFITLNCYSKGKGRKAERIVQPSVMVLDYVIVDAEMEEEFEETEEDAPF